MTLSPLSRTTPSLMPGRSWSRIDSFFDSSFQAVKWIDHLKMFIAVGTGSAGSRDASIITSKDGITWTGVSLPKDGIAPIQFYKTIANSNSIIIAGCNNANIVTSSNGINWSRTESIFWNNPTALTHEPRTLNLFYAGAASGGAANLYTSSNGINWAETNSDNYTLGAHNYVTGFTIPFGGSVSGVRVGFLGNDTDNTLLMGVYLEADFNWIGINFPGLPGSNQFAGATVGVTPVGHLICALLTNGRIITSSNVVNWGRAPTELPSDTTWRDICWTGKEFVAIGDSRFGFSTNGRDWSTISGSYPGSLKSIASNGDIVVAVESTTSRLYVSTS
jgi:hypothetical protein